MIIEAMISRGHLKETIDLASLNINIDIEVAWGGGKTWNGLDIGGKGVPVTR